LAVSNSVMVNGSAPYRVRKCWRAPTLVSMNRPGRIRTRSARGTVLSVSDLTGHEIHLASRPTGQPTLDNFRLVEVTVAGAAPSISAYLGALGMPGLTAYVGILDIGAMRPGEAVFVSAAAGAVGSLAGQIAKLRGASRVVGSAGSAAKVEYLTKLGYDAAFNYHDAPVRDQLKAAAPDGIDV